MMFRMMVLTWFALFAAATAVPVAKAAEETEDKAKEAFNKGSELFEQGQFSAAAIQFRIAYKNKPTWKLLYNIGQCETGAKRYGLALEAFEQYLVEAGDDISIERRDEVRGETVRLREMVGSLKVTGPAGTEVFVDGVKRGNLPLTGYVSVTSAVEHTVSGVLDGKKMETVIVKVLTTQVLDVKLLPTADAAAPSSGDSVAGESDESKQPEQATAMQNPESTPANSPQSTHEMNGDVRNDATPSATDSAEETSQKLTFFGWGALAVGGAALAASIVTGSLALKKDGQLKDQCLAGFDGYECVVTDTSENTELKTKRDALGWVTTGLWIGGGALAATGVILLILSKKRKETASARWRVQPVVSEQLGGGIFTWHF